MTDPTPTPNARALAVRRILIALDQGFMAEFDRDALVQFSNDVSAGDSELVALLVDQLAAFASAFLVSLYDGDTDDARERLHDFLLEIAGGES